MGCFLACFGYSKKGKNRRKSISGSRNIILSQDQGHGSYVPLQLEFTTKSNIKKKSINLDSEFRSKLKDGLKSKIKKKVRFNLNVKTYEPIPTDEAADKFSDSIEKEIWERHEDETKKVTTSAKIYERNLARSEIALYPSNYRYQNYSDYYDEEDEIRLEESDLDDEEFSDTNEEEGYEGGEEEEEGGWKPNEFELIGQFYTQDKGSDLEKVGNAELPVEESKTIVSLSALPVHELKRIDRNNNVRDRSLYVHSVLNPVENLCQWKAIKAKSKPPLKRQKENMTANHEQEAPLYQKPSFNPLISGSHSNSDNSKPLVQEMAVETSLANWLITPNNKRLSSPSTRNRDVTKVSNSWV